jgi:DNA ligase 1
MKAFADLLDRLILSPRRTDKLRHLIDAFAHTPDPDRGWMLAALTGELSFANAKAGTLRALVEERIDPELFRLSYDYVGDLAETIALIWPEGPPANRAPDICEVVETLQTLPKAQVPARLTLWLDALDADGRWAMLKLVTGGMRAGVSARLAKQALADWAGVEVDAIEEIWHGQSAPYGPLFDWLEGRTGRPPAGAAGAFRPVMLAHPLEEADRERLEPADFVAEWKWDGVRVQAISEGGVRRLMTRTGDDISRGFPDLLAVLTFEGVLDGELLVRGSGGGVGAFNDLQQRLNRKAPDGKLMTRLPAMLRAYDLLSDAEGDARPLSFLDRRARLEALVGASDPTRIDLSPLVAFDDWRHLDALRRSPPDPCIEGVMLKRRDSAYVGGRPRGPWFKWKRDPNLVDCVLMYAQRGHGKRSGLYSDFTFGVWRGDALTPVGKAYFGFTDEELKELDRFVRANTTETFGPVRAVKPELVLEIAFEGLQRSTRHKSGVAMRFPRIHRIRWDKPAAEADRLDALEALLGPA